MLYEVITDQIPGTGLGLALASELVKLMKGKIRVISEEGKGAEFTVSLPLTNTATASKDHGISAINQESINAGIPKTVSPSESGTFFKKEDHLPLLLIVEDNSDVVEYLRAILEKNYRIA